MSSDKVAVIGGGPGGLRAAVCIAEMGGEVVLIEQRDFLGGTPVAENYAGLTPHGEPAQPQIRGMIDAVTAHRLIEVRLGTELAGVTGEPGAFVLTLRTGQRGPVRDGRVRRHHHRHGVRPLRSWSVDPDVRILRVSRCHHPG